MLLLTEQNRLKSLHAFTAHASIHLFQSPAFFRECTLKKGCSFTQDHAEVLKPKISHQYLEPPICHLARYVADATPIPPTSLHPLSPQDITTHILTAYQYTLKEIITGVNSMIKTKLSNDICNILNLSISRFMIKSTYTNNFFH